DRRRERLADPEGDRLVALGRAREAADGSLQLWADTLKCRAGLSADPAARALQGADERLQLSGDSAGAPLHGVGRAERPVAGSYRFLGLVRERLVDEPQKRVVLPHAQAERDSKRRKRHDQPRTQLLQVTDHRELLVMAQVPSGYRHRSPGP